jgi:lysozyme
MFQFLRLFKPSAEEAAPIARRVVTGTAAMIVAAAGFIAGWEGLYTHAYRDVVGIPTICYGHIEDVKMGDYRTPEQCKKLLAEDLPRYQAMVKRAVPKIEDYPLPVQVAVLSLTYNIGGGGFAHSTVARRLNAGDRRGACDAILMWNKAGGRVIRGLVNRRRAERALCLKDKL